jgi:hypothetical protein
MPEPERDPSSIEESDTDPFPVPVPAAAAALEPEPADVDSQESSDSLDDVPTRKPRTPAQIEATRRMQEASAAARRGGGSSGRTRKRGSAKKDTAGTKAPTDAALKRDALKSLERWRAELGAGGLYIAPVPATYIAQTDDEVLAAAVELAARNGKVLRALAGGGDVLAGLVLLRWAAGLGVAVGVHTGRVGADSVIAETFGIDRVVADLEQRGFVSVEAVEHVEPDGRPAGVASEDGTDSAEPELPGVADAARAGVAVV